MTDPRSSTEIWQDLLKLHSQGPEPVQVTPATTEVTYRIPPAPAPEPAVWVPKGQPISIGSHTIIDGMVYVGCVLRTPYGGHDPCLIDPSRPVEWAGTCIERQTAYWPSYVEISPVARKVYLDWLSSGRQQVDADMGYVFLYFYGLERRVILDSLTDPTAREEWPDIATELRRLKAIYGKKSHTFAGYVAELLQLVELAICPPDAYLQPLPKLVKTWEFPMYLKLMLGQASKAQAPLPAALALAWVTLSPAARDSVAVTRCADEFLQLFSAKYHAEFGAGIVLGRPSALLKLAYRPASPAYRSHGEVTFTFDNAPNASVLVEPVGKLKRLVDATADELDAYSRYVGRHPDSQGTFDAAVLLPSSAWPAAITDVIAQLKTQVQQCAPRATLTLPFAQLLEALNAKSVSTRERLVALATALQTEGLGMEPDVLQGAKVPAENELIALFERDAAEPIEVDSPGYSMATLALQTATLVAQADGDPTGPAWAYLHQQVQFWDHLTPAHHKRLAAKLEHIAVQPLTVANLRKRLESVEGEPLAPLAALLTGTALAAGPMSVPRLKLLEKLYKLLKLDPAKVFGDIHTSATAGVTSQGTSAPTGTPAAATPFTLDFQRVETLQKETAAVSALLANIFTDEQSSTPPAPAAVDAAPVVSPGFMASLPAVVQSFGQQLLARPEWTRADLQAMATELDLMLDGVLEQLNEASFDAFDTPLTEGDDPIVVNHEILESL